MHPFPHQLSAGICKKCGDLVDVVGCARCYRVWLMCWGVIDMVHFVDVVNRYRAMEDESMW